MLESVTVAAGRDFQVVEMRWCSRRRIPKHGCTQTGVTSRRLFDAVPASGSPVSAPIAVPAKDCRGQPGRLSVPPPWCKTAGLPRIGARLWVYICTYACAVLQIAPCMYVHVYVHIILKVERDGYHGRTLPTQESIKRPRCMYASAEDRGRNGPGGGDGVEVTHCIAYVCIRTFACGASLHVSAPYSLPDSPDGPGRCRRRPKVHLAMYPYFSRIHAYDPRPVEERQPSTESNLSCQPPAQCPRSVGRRKLGSGDGERPRTFGGQTQALK